MGGTLAVASAWRCWVRTTAASVVRGALGRQLGNVQLDGLAELVDIQELRLGQRQHQGRGIWARRPRDVGGAAAHLDQP